MHYKNGREAQNGDKVVYIPAWGPPMVGILYDAVAGNDTCNGRISVTSASDPMPNLRECLHFDDVKAATENAVNPGELARLYAIIEGYRVKFGPFLDPAQDVAPAQS